MTSKQSIFGKFTKLLPGMGLCMGISIAASFIAPHVHIGSVATAIIIGIILGNILKLGESFEPGCKFNEKILLGWAIALMGIKLDLAQLRALGLKSILLIVFAMAVTIISAVFIGRIFKLKKSFALLLGIGNGICGSSAIAATKDIVGADKHETGISIGIINFLGTLGIFLLPAICKLLHLPDSASGVYIGNTLQAVGQVTASGFSISSPAGQAATIIKMGRILMLIPVCFILSFALGKNRGDSQANESAPKAKKPAIPRFIIGYAAMAAIRQINFLPDEAISFISTLSHYALIMAMAAIGLKITLSQLKTHGKSALITAACVFCVQIIFNGLAVKFMF